MLGASTAELSMPMRRCRDECIAKGQIDVNDLGLKETLSLKKAALAASTYNALILEVYFSSYNHDLPQFMLYSRSLLDIL